MKSTLPPMIRAAHRLLREVEISVSTFPRKHRYAIGADLRAGATSARLLSQQAFLLWRDPPRCLDKLSVLSEEVDAIKLRLQIGYELQAFPSHGRFEEVAIIARDLGRQCGAAMRSVKQHLNGQNPAASAPRERASTLSSRVTAEAVN